MEESPGFGVFILDGFGRVEYATRTAGEIFFRCGLDRLVGRSLSSLVPEEYACDLLARQRAAPVHGERVIWGGWQTIVTSTVDESGTREGSLACTVQRVPGMIGDRWRGLRVHTAEWTDLGPLDALTTRELEVAAMIGLAMSVRDIAASLHRSVKTVENHRISMGRKLAVASRLEIALLAYNAGLRPADSALRRLPTTRNAQECG